MVTPRATSTTTSISDAVSPHQSQPRRWVAVCFAVGVVVGGLSSHRHAARTQPWWWKQRLELQEDVAVAKTHSTDDSSLLYEDSTSSAWSNWTRPTLAGPYDTPSTWNTSKSVEQRLWGTWLGNWWIPPSHWKLYNVSELIEFYRGTDWLMWGDSSNRRSGMTFWTLLTCTTPHAPVFPLQDPRIIDINKGKVVEKCLIYDPSVAPLALCRTFPPHPRDKDKNNNNRDTKKDPYRFVLVQRKCLSDVLESLELELNPDHPNWNFTTDTDLLILQMGKWHEMRRCPGTEIANADLKQGVEKVLRQLQLLLEARPHLTVVWRTGGWFYGGENGPGRVLNDLLLQEIPRWFPHQHDPNSNSSATIPHARVILVDWGTAMFARSFRERRIMGDIKPHYGWEARVLLLQMITNRLAEVGWKPRSRRGKLEQQ